MTAPAPASAPAAPDLPPGVLAALTAALPSMIATAIGQLTTAAVPAPDAPPAPTHAAPWTLATAEPDTDEPSPAPDTAPVPSPDAPADTAPQATTEPCANTEPAAAPVPAPTVPQAGGKAAPGALRAAVARLLAEHPGESFTVTQAAKLVGGKSGGAVGNALDRLTASGHAARVSEKPRTYTATPATATAATGAPAPVSPAAPRPARPRAPKASKTAPTPAAPAEVAPAPQPAWDGRSPLPRLNGAHYHPRTLADTSDVAALRTLRAEGVSALLYGPPGTGKTSLVEAAFPDAITVCGDGDTQVSDLIGSYTQRPDGGYEFVYGPLVTAMREGQVLFLDDATLIPPTVLAALYPGMDGRRQITVKEHKGETITAAAGFYVIAGHNPHVHGAILSDALSSRFSVQIEVSSDYDLARTLKIDSTAVRVAKNLATRKAKGEIGWAPQLRELLAFHKIQTILGKDAAWSNLLGIAPPEDRDTVATALKAALGREVTHLALGRQL
jgi:nitric oxide reductase NorQ protein